MERLLPGIVTISPALYAGGAFPRVVGVVSVLATVEPLAGADAGAEDGAVHPAIQIAIKISSTVRMQSERDFLYVIMILRAISDMIGGGSFTHQLRGRNILSVIRE